MRYNPGASLTAKEIVNYWSSQDIEKILREYGEEPFSKQIAKNIINFRKVKSIENTQQLAEIIRRTIPVRCQLKKIHFATKTFQALRIAVNDELNNLQKALLQAPELLKPGGRLAVISFHSLEDRIAKNFFKEQENKNIIKVVTKKPITPSLQELKINPRSRSAKLRAAIKY